MTWYIMYMEVNHMKTLTTLHRTRPFMSGRSQAIRIPKDLQLAKDKEVVVNRIGNSLVITPCDALEEMFYSALSMFTDDFMADGRPEEVPNERIEL